MHERKFIRYGEPYGVKAYKISLLNTSKIIFSSSVEFDEKSLFSRSSYVMKETGSGHLTNEITKLRLPQATTTKSKNDRTKSENSPNERMIVGDNRITISSSTNPLLSTQSSASYIHKFEPLQHNNEGKHMEGRILRNRIIDIGATSSLQLRNPSNQYIDLHDNHDAPTTNAAENKGKKLNQLPHSQISTTQDERLITSAAKTVAKSVTTKSAT